MESVLLKANLINLSTGHNWLNFDGKKGMSDREGHGHKAVLYKNQFPPLRHSLLERHRCIHRLINHVYTKGQALILIIAPRQIFIKLSIVHLRKRCDFFSNIAFLCVPFRRCPPVTLNVIFKVLFNNLLAAHSPSGDSRLGPHVTK